MRSGTYRMTSLFALAAMVTAACKEEVKAPTYQTLPVTERNIVVTAQAAGTVQPDTTVEVKSKASGEILGLPIETGQVVKRGQLLATVDPRVPRNTLAQAQASLDVAQARLANAVSQLRRAEELFKTQSITEQEHEQALLDRSNANAEVISAQINVDNARDQLDDTQVLAPIDGTILAKQVERGQVISSPTRDVGGGTVLLTMADLDLVQVRTLVDETDIGKITPGQRATVMVEAYPNRPFEGTVLKIEPQALTEQNVTTFPVLIRIDNREGLLRPGMNAEVEIHVGERDEVLAVPNAALRTARDAGSAAQVLGLSEDSVQRVAAAGPGGGSTGANRERQASTTDTLGQIRRSGKGRGNDSTGTARSRNGNGSGMRGPRGGGNGARSRSNGMFGGRYIVFVRRNGQTVPVWVRTGLTDLDYSEVIDGLSATDSVLLLPSASLMQTREQQQQWINRRTQSTGLGGGGTAGGGRPR